MDLKVFRRIEFFAQGVMAVLKADEVRSRAVFGLVFLLTIGAGMVFVSWQKWPDLLVDFGRELYVPWQLSEGKVLYKDIGYLFGPLSPYLNAGLFKAFGVHILTLAVFNILLVGILTWVMFRIFLMMTDWLTAVLVCGVFLGVFAFGQYVPPYDNYNFVCPYTYNLTHGIFLSFLCFYAYLVYVNTRKNRWLFLIGLLLGAIFLTKVEVFIAITAAMFFGISVVMLLDRPGFSKAARSWGMVVAGFVLPVGLCAVCLSRQMPLQQVMQALHQTMTINPVIAANVFYRRLLGIDHLAVSLWKLTAGLIWYALVFLDIAFLNRYLGRNARKASAFFDIAVVSGLLFLMMVCVLIFKGWGDILRPLPVVLLVLGVWQFLVLWRKRHDLKEISRRLVFVTFSVFAFLLLLKIFLNVHAYHYGFALAMPGALILAAALVYYLPILLEKELHDGSLIRILGMVLLGVFVVVSISISTEMYAMKTQPVGAGADRLYDFDPGVLPRSMEIRVALEWINKIVKPDKTLAVFPEGVMLNYWTRRVNPTPYINFMPPDLEFFGKSEILDSFVKTKPDYTVIVDRNFREYGCSISQEPCGGGILRWILKNYVPVVRVGHKPFNKKGFGLIMYKRIDAPVP